MIDGRTTHHLFVYGTLLKSQNHRMHQYLEKNTTYAGVGTFQGKLYNIGYYPGAVPSENPSDKILGELYAIRDWSVIKALDAYEGCWEEPAEFIRAIVPVQLENGELIKAYIYLYNLDICGLMCIHSGDYASFILNVFHQK